MRAYTQRRKTGAAPERALSENRGPSVSELAAGARPTSAQMGSRVDLPEEIREKMEQSFGADFSNVRLFESETVADAGAEAVTQGNNIAFAPGKLDLASTAGQALLGHELSHVVSQSRGESAGRGFLNDAHLEAQADRQGEMAARGESVYQGPVSPVGASSTASAAGPMQAKKKSTVDAEKEAARENAQLPSMLHPFQRQKAKNAYLDKRSRRKGAKRFTQSLIDEFNGVDMGDTEESRQAGIQRQVEMLIDMGATVSSKEVGGSLQDPYSDISSVNSAMKQIFADLAQREDASDYVDGIVNARDRVASQALEKYHNGEYGPSGEGVSPVDQARTRTRMSFSPEGMRPQAANITLDAFGSQIAHHTKDPIFQHYYRATNPYAPGARGQTEAETEFASLTQDHKLAATLGEDEYAAFHEAGDRDRIAATMEWYRRHGR